MKKSKKRNFCVVTSSRADYGIMSKFLKVLTKKHNTKIIVTGTHLSKKFGYTVKEINKDKIKIYKKISIIPKNDKETDVSKTISKAINNFSKHIFVAPYKFTGDTALSVLIAITFFTLL